MAGMDDGPSGSGRRWWEIRSGRDQDEGGYGSLMTGGRSRTRLERSLSAGADPAEEPTRKVPAFVWPLASLVGVGVVVLGVVFLMPKFSGDDTTTAATENTSGEGSTVESFPRDEQRGGTPMAIAPSGSGGRRAANPPQGGSGAVGSLRPLRLPPAAAFGGPPGGFLRSPGGTARGRGYSQPDATIQGDPATPPPSEGVDEPVTETSPPPSTPTNGGGANTQQNSIQVAGSAPAPPGRQNGDAQPVSGSGGCDSGGRCTVTEPVPIFFAGQSEPRAAAPARTYDFLCQTSGASYTTADGETGHWWAWYGRARIGVWAPAVFLEGGGDGPVPGLRKCV